MKARHHNVHISVKAYREGYVLQLPKKTLGITTMYRSEMNAVAGLSPNKIKQFAKKTSRERKRMLKYKQKPRRQKEVRLGYCFTPYQRLRLYNDAPFSRLKPPASPTGSKRRCIEAKITTIKLTQTHEKREGVTCKSKENVRYKIYSST